MHIFVRATVAWQIAATFILFYIWLHMKPDLH